MRMKIGLPAIAGIFGLLAAAEAASPFDGTYQFSSSTKVNQAFENKGAMGFCPDRRPGPFTVVDGQAQYTTETGSKLAAAVGPNGVFQMRFVNPDGSGPLVIDGAIDNNGIVRVRQKGNSCSYDFVWQKQQ